MPEASRVPSVVSAGRVVRAPADEVFALIADPAQQPRWDGNDNLAGAASGQRVTAVGDVFSTTLTSGSVRENHVVELEQDRLLAWTPADPGRPPAGHLWRWQLEPVGERRTRVTHTYDWSRLTDPDRLPRAQATTPAMLRASLDRLAALAEGPESPLSPVVCLPMLRTTAAFTAAAFEPALEGSGRTVVWLELPGHGDAPALPEATSEAVLAVVLDAVQRADDGAPVLLAGGSYGAYLAAAVARRRPDLVRGLLLVCPGVRVAAEHRDLTTPPQPSAPGRLDRVDDRFRGHLDQALGSTDPEVAARVSALLVDGTRGDDAFRDDLQAHGQALADEAAEVGFDGPTTIVVGRRDRIVGRADQARRLALHPRATFAELDDAGHYLPLEQPELFRALVQEWSRRCG